MDSKTYNPYSGNILVDGLGPILNRDSAYTQLLYLPEIPLNIEQLPKQVRLHCLMSLLDFHIPGLEGARIYETIDLLLRQSYRYRDPRNAETWSIVGGEEQHQPNILRAPAMAAIVAAHAGAGKTRAILRACDCFPKQVITHDSFPQLVAPHHQVAWLSVDAPASGKSEDLAENLMNAWDDVLEKHDPNYMRRFTESLEKVRRDGTRMLNEWRQVAIAHFLGVLHLDEVQNFFKLATLKQRRGKNKPDEIPELSIVEDKTLKWILSLLNTFQIPVIFSGTPDGVGALTKRLSTTQRITTGGYHNIKPFTNANSKEFKDVFFQQLLRYQYVKRPLDDSDEFRQLVIDLTAGIPRIIMSLWFAAHRVAFERKEDSLRFSDFKKAANTILAPLKPAIATLNSGDPVKMARYDDLIPRDDGIWASFWNPTI